MKKYIYAFVLFCFGILAFGQNYGGTVVSGVIPIPRIMDSIAPPSSSTPPISTPPLVTTAPTGNSQEVGITEGQLSVSLTGAANYSIPIAVPPGINGVVPQINLAYSSQGGNGLAGYGWNISGISSITRIASTMFHDGIIDPVDFDNLDRFALDGQRLIVKSGVYGSDGAVYETENFSNLKVTSIGVSSYGANYGPQSFKVEYPDGSIGVYGITSSTRSLTDFAISYWQNPQGVRISYEYSTLNNVLTISKISYGATFTTSGINEIKFVYDTSPRTRPEQAFVGGQILMNTKILKKIEVLGNGVGFRNYYLDYNTTSLGYQRLISITEKTDNDSKFYNPTVFSYDTTNNDSLFDPYLDVYLPFTGLNNQNTKIVPGDFDADGKTDMIIYNKNNPTSYKLITKFSTDSYNFGIEHSIGAFEEIFPTTFTNFSNKLMPMQGWCVIKKLGNDYIFEGYNSWFNENLLTPTLHTNSTKTITFPSSPVMNGCTSGTFGGTCIQSYGPSYTPPKKFFSGDFNGDGITDVIGIETGGINQVTCNYCYPGNTSGCTEGSCYSNWGNYQESTGVYFIDLKYDATTTPLGVGSISNAFYLNAKVEILDYNGDGKSDIIVELNGNVRVFSLNNQNNQLVTMVDYTESGIQTNKPFLIGDYNGDGKMDFCIPQVDDQDIWNFYFSNGKDTFVLKQGSIGTPYSDFNCTYFQKFEEFYFVAADFNSDGKTDIIKLFNNTTIDPTGDNTGEQCQAYYSNTEAIRSAILFCENKIANPNQIEFLYNPTVLGNVGFKRYPIISLFDHNNPRNKSEFSLILDNKIHTFKQSKDASVDALLKTITTGNGVVETITYKPLKKEVTNTSYTGSNPNVFFPELGFIENYPNQDIVIAPSFKVVSKLEKQSANVYKKQFYTYYGPVSNVEGIGFLGFRAKMITNWVDENGTNIISNISKSNISLRGANSESFTAVNFWNANSSTPTTNFISKTINTYNINNETGVYEQPLLSNKVFKLKNTKSEQYNGLDNTSSVTTTKYDDDNNPTSSITNLKNGSVLEQTTTTAIGYESPTNQPVYVKGRPSSKTSTVIINPSQGLPNEDTSITEELYGYTNHLLTQVQKRNTNSGFTSPYITENNIFDVWGNITKKTISYPGLADRVTDYEYDPGTHRFLIKSFDIEHLATEFSYDISSGVLLTETLPSNLGHPLTTTYKYDKWFKKTRVTDYLGIKKVIEYARATEKTFITTTGDDGSYSTELFDDLGRKIQTGVKNINGVMTHISYEYDIYDRNYKVSEPYFGMLNAPTQWNETIYDGYGRMTQSNLFTGKKVEVVYNGLTTSVGEKTTSGQPATTSLQKTKISTKNAIGQLVSTTDTTPMPSAETITYTYFANGNLKTTLYNGAETKITQDEWGRKKSLDDPSAGKYEYTYNGFGETLTEKTPKGLTIYVLDDWGKIMTKTIVGDLTNSTTTTTYDPTTKLLTATKFEDFSTNAPEILTTNYNYEYDDYKRLWRTSESSPQAFYQTATQFDSFGRNEKEYYHATNISDNKSSSKWIKHTYLNGYHWQIKDNETNTMLWQTDVVNARGQLITAQYGNGVGIESHSNDVFGLPAFTDFRTQIGSNASANPFMTLTTAFNAQTGNLNSRNNSFNGAIETFGYDNLDRLTSYPDQNGLQVTQNYDDSGRITANNLGEYRYSTAKPYWNTGVKIATPQILAYYGTRTPQQIAYNAFKKPVTLSEYNQEKLDFEYNAGGSRSVMYYGDYQTAKNLRKFRKFYSSDGSMEIKRNLTNNTVEFITYIGGDGYSAPIVLKSDGTTQIFLYLHRDYQSTILAITDAAGLVLEKRAFDAWGSLIKFVNSSGITTVPTTDGVLLLDRGYTGHEHLLGVGLINMNARLYDPKLHRFLSPDNFVQDPTNTQSFNRYAYCWNNPLKHADYNGEWFFWDDLAAAVIGGVINWAMNGAQFNAQGLSYFAVGAASGIGTLYGGPLVGAAISGLGNDLTKQLATTGKIDIGQAFGATLTSVAVTFIFCGVFNIPVTIPRVPVSSVSTLTPAGMTTSVESNVVTTESTVVTQAASTTTAATATQSAVNSSKELAKAGFKQFTNAEGQLRFSAPIIEGATQLDEVAVTAAKNSGAYMLKFASGKFYIGKGLEARMLQSINRIKTNFGDELLESKFYPANNYKNAYIKEFQLMEETGQLPLHWDKNSMLYNKIWSPGKKLLGQ